MMETTEKIPKVSVCVMTYNQDKYIHQCLQSIVDQKTDFDFEVIVGDDCSTDNTRAIIENFAKNYPNQIVPIYHAKNTGIVGNYLAVHRRAQGEYVCHVDGDDWISPEKLTKQAAYLDNFSKCPLVAHQMTIWNSEKIVGFTRLNPESIDLSLLLRKHPLFLHSSIMYRRSQVGPVFSNDFFFIDFYVYISAALKGPLGFLNLTLGNYRENIGISSSRNLIPNIEDAINLAAREIGETADVLRGRSKQYLSHSLSSLRNNDTNQFKNLLSSAIKADKFWIMPRLIAIASISPNTLKRLLLLYRKLR